MVGEYYCIAIGQGFGYDIGTKVTVTLTTGSFPAIVADLKQNRHTVDGLQGKDGSVIEFIVDVNRLPDDVRRSGTVGTLDQFSGEVIGIEVER